MDTHRLGQLDVGREIGKRLAAPLLQDVRGELGLGEPAGDQVDERLLVA